MAKQDKFTLKDFLVSSQEIEDGYWSIVGSNPFFSNLTTIFHLGMKDMSLFPYIRLGKGSTYMDYLSKWVKGYMDAVNNPPSCRRASPKGSCSDPAVQTIVQIASNADRSFAERMSMYHNLFMSAENIQGNLLEEYISKSVLRYGWIWCMGNVLRAVDFCSGDGSVLLQVKNKSNTENSSSSAIREGTSIKKWYRLGTQTKNGEKLPVYKWKELNEIINSHVVTKPEKPCCMTEESYQEFLAEVAIKNPGIISDK